MQKIYIILLVLFPMFLFSQHENDNWNFGNNQWKFDNGIPNGFSHSIRNPYIRYTSSVASDKTTGALLFYSDGYRVYNKNNITMDSGDDLFGVINYDMAFSGNPSDQSSIILPKPGSDVLFYLFYINGSRITNDQTFGTVTSYNYGLRYAIIDMSLNGGLGKVISKNNILFTNSPINALSSTFGNDGNSFWIVTAKNYSNFLSFKLDIFGLTTTPVISSTNIPASGLTEFNFLKISPNSKKLLIRDTYTNMYLYNFDNISGIINNRFEILPTNNSSLTYLDYSNSRNTAEFSSDSNIIYFTSAITNATIQIPPISPISRSGLSMYNILTNTLVGGADTGLPTSAYPLQYDNIAASLQLGTNGKIYLIYNHPNHYDGSNQIVDFGYDNYNHTIFNPFNWGVIANPNNWDPTLNPLSSIVAHQNVKNGFSFPQLIPIYQSTANPCVQDIHLNAAESNNNYIYHASNSIITDANYSIQGNTITFKAGNFIKLLPNTHIQQRGNSYFLTSIEDCKIISNAVRQANDNFQKIEILDGQLSSDIRIYPNPATSFIKIAVGLNDELVSWEMYNMSGKLIIKGIKSEIYIETIVKSTYLIKIKTKLQTITKKVIVN